MTLEEKASLPSSLLMKNLTYMILDITHVTNGRVYFMEVSDYYVQHAYRGWYFETTDEFIDSLTFWNNKTIGMAFNTYVTSAWVDHLRALVWTHTVDEKWLLDLGERLPMIDWWELVKNIYKNTFFHDQSRLSTSVAFKEFVMACNNYNDVVMTVADVINALHVAFTGVSTNTYWMKTNPTVFKDITMTDTTVEAYSAASQYITSTVWKYLLDREAFV